VKEEDAYEVLREVCDPEIPVNIVDLGLICEVTCATISCSCPMSRRPASSWSTSPPEPMTEDARWELGIA
jgi:hypothetical protein